MVTNNRVLGFVVISVIVSDIFFLILLVIHSYFTEYDDISHESVMQREISPQKLVICFSIINKTKTPPHSLGAILCHFL